MSTATYTPTQHPELTVDQCRERHTVFQTAIDAIKAVVPYCSPTAQSFWNERARDLEANAEYWACRAKDKGRAL